MGCIGYKFCSLVRNAGGVVSIQHVDHFDYRLLVPENRYWYRFPLLVSKRYQYSIGMHGITVPV